MNKYNQPTDSLESNNTIEVVSKSQNNSLDYQEIREKLGQFGLDSFKYLISQIESTNNEKLKNEANKVLQSISKENDVIKISGLALELQEIVNKYNQEKKEIVNEAKEGKEGMSEDVKNAPEIKDPQEFILDLLEAKNGWKNRIESSINEAEKLSETEIVEKIKGISVYFDVEPEDWDIYFKENNIPKEKQLQFKKYYLELKGRKTDWFDTKFDKQHDFGNISFINDFGDDISEEAERILNLPEGSIITIKLADLNPSSGNLEFKDKKSALLYLYYTKLLFKEVGTFLEDIKQGVINIGKGIWITLKFLLWDHIGETIWTVLGYMGVATALTMGRKINGWIILRSSGHIGFGNYLDPSKPGAEGQYNIEGTELDRREELLKSLREEFAGDPEKLAQIDKIEEKYLYLLDHNIDLDKELKKELREIEKEIYAVKKDLKEGTVSKKEAKEILKSLNKQYKVGRRKLFRLFQGSFDAQVAYLRGTKNRYFDTFGKWILLSTESENRAITNRRKKFKNKIKESLFNVRNGEVVGEKSFLKDLNTYIEYSHRILNDLEGILIQKYSIYLEDLRNGKFKLPVGLTDKNYEKLIKNQILQDLRKLGFDIEENFQDKVSKFKDARKNLGSLDYSNPEKLEKKVLNDFPGINGEKLEQMKVFYQDILIGDNKYDLRTASDIASRILKGLTFSKALEDSFKIKPELIENIKIEGNNLALTARNLADNSFIELTKDTKRNDINILEKSKESIKDKSKKGFFNKYWENLKDFKLFKGKTPEEAEEVIEKSNKNIKSVFIEYLSKYPELKEKFKFYLEKRESKKIIDRALKYIKSVKDISDKERKFIIETLNNYKNNIEKILIGKNKLERINNLKKLINTLIDYEKIKIDKVELNVEKNNKQSKSQFKSESQKPKSSPEKLSPQEKIKKINNLYKRAILQAELNGIEGVEERFLNLDLEKTTVEQEESFIKSNLGLEEISDLRKIYELKVEKKLIIEKLVNEGILEKVGDTFEIKSGKIDELTQKLKDLGRPHFIEYIKKALKHGKIR